VEKAMIDSEEKLEKALTALKIIAQAVKPKTLKVDGIDIGSVAENAIIETATKAG
jgi:hypothetical protein